MSDTHLDLADASISSVELNHRETLNLHILLRTKHIRWRRRVKQSIL
ncbi:MAG: hypothetical protein AAGG56_13975 [Pseudomonadota bacterium]